MTMDPSVSTGPVDTRRRWGAEVALAGVLAVLGIALTSGGIFAHLATLVAPGAALVLVGGAWLGHALARAEVPLFPKRSESRSR
jgi:uncharacterized membrane protein HdeD (DUF308 family)